MNRLFMLIAIVSLLMSIGSCQSFADEQNVEFSDFPPMPDMVGVPPDKRVKNWIKFDFFGTMNHPFSILWFSSQEFERDYPNVLIKLSQEEYEQFKLFVRTNECEKKLNNVQGDPLLTITEYARDHQMVRCIIPSDKACEYMTKMYALPKISWTEKQTEQLRLMGNDLHCEFANNKFQPVKY